MSLTETLKGRMDDQCARDINKRTGRSREEARDWCSSRPDEAYGTTSDEGWSPFDPFGQLEEEGAKVYPTGRGPSADTSRTVVQLVDAAEAGVKTAAELAAELAALAAAAAKAGTDAIQGKPLVSWTTIALVAVAAWYLTQKGATP